MSTSPSTKPHPVELFATLGLALSTLIAVTAVSIGIARADALTTGVTAKSAPFIAICDR
jgi:hypothetical protein